MPETKGNDASGKAPPDQSFRVTPPAITLPRGSGAIRGIDEKFAANSVTGTGLMTVPIATSPGRSGFGLQLSLSYDSGAWNGPFGFGWSLSPPSITRKTDKGLPQHLDGHEEAADRDVFILSGAEDLVPEFEEEHEACRHLKGAMLRKEVYADDARPGASVEQIQCARPPYTVTEQNFTVLALQPRAANRHAVFFTHACEVISAGVRKEGAL